MGLISAIKKALQHVLKYVKIYLYKSLFNIRIREITVRELDIIDKIVWRNF